MAHGGENMTAQAAGPRGPARPGPRRAPGGGVGVQSEEQTGPADRRPATGVAARSGRALAGATLAGRQSKVVLPNGPAAPTAARRFARAALDAWHLGPLSDAVELVVSELVTNAVRHARPVGASPVRLVLACDDDVLRVEVHDADPARAPRPRRPDPDDLAEGGRGLALIQALAARWGCRPGPTGKAVWCELPAHP